MNTDVLCNVKTDDIPETCSNCRSRCTKKSQAGTKSVTVDFLELRVLPNCMDHKEKEAEDRSHLASGLYSTIPSSPVVLKVALGLEIHCLKVSDLPVNCRK